MNTKILFLPIIGATTFFILLFTFTKFLGPIPFSINSVTTTKSTTFDVVGEGKVTVKPDIALVTVGIQSNAPSVRATQDQINTIINKVSQAIKNIGVDPKDIQTTNYNISPDYDYSNTLQRIKGYHASTNLSVKVRQLDNVNQVIDVATQNGANQVGGVNFDVADKTKMENEARQKAVDEAKKKAENAAKIAGFRLGKIINYSENSRGYIKPYPMLEVMSAKLEGAAPTQIEPGSTDITMSVTLSYEIQ